MTDTLRDILNRFALDAEAVSCQRNGSGHINETYLAETASGRRYTLQKISGAAFKDIPGLMENVIRVTEHLRQRTTDPRETLHLIDTREGEKYIPCPDGGAWRVYDRVENALCLDAPERPEDLFQSAVAFGRFQELLQDFPAETLHESIPRFHDTINRYRLFREKLAADPLGRAREVGPEIDFVLAHEEEAGTLVQLQRDGTLPTRVTHNDAKLNNVLLDAVTRKALCVIDLDTVMPGLSLYDYGDSIRFGAATAAEDERDLSKMEMDLELFSIYTKGFLSACPGLTPEERELLPTGAKLMTLECGVRFLTDYLDGDHYFSIHRPGHNLDRARTQFKLVSDMERKWSRMCRAVTE